MQLHWKCPTIGHMSQWYGCYPTLSSISRHGHQTGKCSASTRQKNARVVNIFVPQLWARMLAGLHVCSITSTHGAHTLMASVQNEVTHILAPLIHVSLAPKQTKWILTHAPPTYLPFLLVGRILLLISSHDPRHLYGRGLRTYQKCKI